MSGIKERAIEVAREVLRDRPRALAAFESHMRGAGGWALELDSQLQHALALEGAATIQMCSGSTDPFEGLLDRLLARYAQRWAEAHRQRLLEVFSPGTSSPTETREQRQARRWQQCSDAGLTMPADTYGHLPRGIGKVATKLGITRQALAEDLNAHRERIFGR